MRTHGMLLQLLEKPASTNFCQIQRPTSRYFMLMLHDVQSSNVRLLVVYPMVSSMESHQLIPSSTQDTSSSSPLDWARNIFKRRGQSGEEIEFQGHSPTVVEAPYAQGKRRNASGRDAALAKQRQQKMKPLPSKNSTAGNSQPPKPIVVKPPSQTQAVASSSTTPATGDASEATTSTPSRPDATIRQAGLWTRFWLFLGCLSPEYTDDHH
ncbi:hypothetical protein F4604DRAFT_1906546 [Suillus subluteus]|nr:hypothetical protein F4604DRAFT_1906546 [Suillus subluteus]